ncbi:M28 family peptidase [Desulfuromonas sp.]|uniref:M28 family peptidase n=1 Tax=Desulfuromonas sp. TaxID=892 RepID=UPI0025BC0FFF|nr:M28 family peptidase [Desulfuromonas sp.]
MIILFVGIAVMLLLGAACFSRRYGAGRARRDLPAAAGQDMAPLRQSLEAHVSFLAGVIGERHMGRFEHLEKAAGYIEEGMTKAGLALSIQGYEVGNRVARNLLGEIPGSVRSEEVVLVGAHYDSVGGSPGANDNASGVAALLELARLLAQRRPERTVRLAAFVNEEPPFFKTGSMGSRLYARRCRQEGEQIAAMICLETIGFYTEAPGSQEFPFTPLRFFYPSKGNFLAFVGNFASRQLLGESLGAFRSASHFPAEGLTAPAWLVGVDWSDHWSFWQAGYPAIMVTDTAPFRYPHYHRPSDTPDKFCYPEMARAVAGLAEMVATLAGGEKMGGP